MSPQRLARVSETNEETEEDDDATPFKEPTMRSPRSANNLHVTINSKPEELEYCNDGSIGGARKATTHDDGTGRRPSALIQDILSSRRPSAIMAAIRSPKQFVTRYRREYERII